MTGHPFDWDAVVIGGGFYGATIASYLAGERGLKRVLLIEREDRLMARASYTNQARVHNGYHYPRSFTTAYRSRVNLPRFVQQWGSSIRKDFTKLYAIAARNSKVTAGQFERFCREIGAPFEPAGPALSQLFEPRLIGAVYRVEEYAFDTTELAACARRALADNGIEVRTGVQADALVLDARGGIQIDLHDLGDDRRERLTSRLVFNCTYSGLNQLGGDFPGTRMRLKHEITEMALVRMPAALAGLGVTVMDGAFFSCMPFPARGLHTLSHVRYTPHLNWNDAPSLDPYRKLDAYPRETRFDRMIRDAARYMPALRDAVHEDSLFEVKTILVKNEGDDGRPILFERHAGLPGCYSILGGKIDNIYDVIEQLDKEALL